MFFCATSPRFPAPNSALELGQNLAERDVARDHQRGVLGPNHVLWKRAMSAAVIFATPASMPVPVSGLP
jgi:hypothetical protein